MRAGQVGAFLLLEHHRSHVGTATHLVQDHVLHIGVVVCHLFQCLTMGVFEVDHQAKAGIRGAPQQIVGLGHGVLGFDRSSL